jgi:DNA-binding NarL/FixJ family response regulator
MVSLFKEDLALEVVGIFNDVRDCIKNVLYSRPDIILTDITKPHINCINDIALFNKKFPHVQILVYTTFNLDQIILKSIYAGVSGYILKTMSNNTLIKAIKELRNGGSSISPPVARRMFIMLQQNPSGKPLSFHEYGLTKREQQLLLHIRNGLSYKMIADDYGITYSTVRSHIKNIYKKLNVNSLTELVSKTIWENI